MLRRKYHLFYQEHLFLCRYEQWIAIDPENAHIEHRYTQYMQNMKSSTLKGYCFNMADIEPGRYTSAENFVFVCGNVEKVSKDASVVYS